MLKRVLVAAAVAGLVASAAVPLETTPAMAGHSGCGQAAKAKFSGDAKMRKAFKKNCKAHWKAYKKAHGKAGRMAG
jgi:hypothetical protein